jgi:hypothetical protein
VTEKILKVVKAKNYLPIKLCVPAVLLMLLAVLFITKTAMAISPIFTSRNQPVDQPFVIELNQAVRGVDTADIKITPKIAGEWRFSGGGLLGKSQLIFIPNQDFRINTTYDIEFGDVDRFLLGNSEVPSVKFTTESAPGLADSGLTQLSDGATIAADYTFSASLKSANHGLRNVVLKTDPAIAAEAAVSDDKNYTWKPENLLPQGTEISVEIYDAKNDVSLKKINLKIAPEPTIKSLVKPDHFAQNDVARIEFNQPITPESRDKIVFDTYGTGTWESDTVYTYKPDAVRAGTTYTYHIRAGLRSKDGGILTKDVDAQFSTIGAAYVTSSSPRGKELSQTAQTIKFTFDQPVNHASAEQHFSVSSGQVSGFTWSGNTISATVTNLGFQHTVTATMAAGVVNDGFGLPSTQPASVSFTTEIRTIKLNVPYYKQQHSATCTAATLRMALAFYGVQTSEEAIVDDMGYNPREMDVANNTWDDPRQMFVGYMDGTTNTTAGGAEIPLQARVAGAFGRSVSQRSGSDVNINWIAQEIHNGHPVIISGTGTSKAGKIITYYAPSTGREVRMSTTGHSRIVYGVRGEPGAPLRFYIHDPSRGKLDWSASQLQNNLRTNPYGGQAVAIY